MTSRQPRILFLTLLNDVGSDRIVCAMARLGAECAVLGTRDTFAARSRFVSKLFPLPRFGGYWWHSLFLASRLETIRSTWTPDLIVPLDDLAARVLRDPRVYGKPDLGRLIEQSLGALTGFETACSRYKLIDAARASGLWTPRQKAVTTTDAAKKAAAIIGYPVVLKREQTCGGFGVQIVKTEDALARAFRMASLKAKAKATLGWIPGFKIVGLGSLVLQEYVEGPLGFHIVACSTGHVLDSVSFAAESTHPPVTGASTILRPIDRMDIEASTAKLVAMLRCSGLVSFDFILTPSGDAVLIEMNPRPVVSGHLGHLFGHDIYKALLDRLRGIPPAMQGTIERFKTQPPAIALFPRELDRDPQGQTIDTTDGLYHDLPFDDPGLIEVYAEWLERRHPRHRASLRRRLTLAPTSRSHNSLTGLEPPKLKGATPSFLGALWGKYGLRLTRRSAS